MATVADSRRASPHARLLTVILVALAGLLGAANGLGRIDQMIYDRAISLGSRTAPDDVLIVMIDDQTVAALGRWPWPRVMHAALLDRLHDARAVGLDIVFAEADQHNLNSDRVLAEAIRRHGRVVLPVVLDNLEQPTHVDLPLGPLARAAAGLGYINIALDDDGVVRRATWTRRVDGVQWEHFALAMLRAGGQDATVSKFLAQLAPAETSLIPYAGPPGHFQAVSYLAVLRGDVPAAAFQDKYVLVGAGATGMGDVFPAPVSHRASGISGAEIMANLLQAARKDLVLQPAQAWQTILASAIPVLVLCLILPQLSPRQAVLCSAGLLVAILAAALAVLWWGNTWVPPTAGLLGVAACYPLWSWRSQEAALRYMDGEMKRLRVEYPPILDEAGPQDGRVGRSLDQHVDELDRTLSRVRNLRRFLIDGLDGMPDATLVIDQVGRLQFRNRPAIMYFLNLSIRPPRIGRTLAPVLEQAFDEPATRQQLREALGPHGSETDLQDAASRRISIELRDRAGQDLLLRC
ncbi:MAG TPA: CHASE2 domain-containing protein, partial [Bordetella sp.]|nr:CHASE2 domain-containing protein [Bordetella sp.]